MVIVNTTQPTILVKKADGSTVRMTLDEVRKMKSASNNLATSQPKQAVVSNVVKKEDRKYVIGGGVQNKILGENKILSKKERDDWSKDDAKALLEESVEAFHPALPKTSNMRNDQVEDVIKKMSFIVSRQFLDRLRNIILLRLKDIRSEEHTKERLTRAIKDGGMGFSEEQVNKVLEACYSVIARSPAVRRGDEAIPLKKSQIPKIKPGFPMVQQDELPKAYVEPPFPANSAPFNSFLSGKGVIARSDEGATKQSHGLPQSRSNATPVRFDERSRISGIAQRQKSVINDISAPPKEMGPVDEIKYFSLVDFRRLSSKPEEAADRLRQKFVTLKEESFLLYIDAVNAWHESPLFLSYMNKVNEALTTGKTLQEVLSEKDSIKMEEINAIVKMESQL